MSGDPGVPARSGLPMSVGAILAGILATVVGTAGCGASEAGGGEADAGARERGYRGVVLSEPLPKPDFVLTDTEGRPFRFREETDGKLTLLFFGYTHCPDVCPVHMANLAAVLEDLPHRDRRRIRVLFVTTDPERDTRERLRSWLDAFDPSFVGLRGSPERVNGIQRRLDLPPAVRQPAAGSDRGGSDYTVGHASQVIAFTADGRGRVAYPFGTRQADWAHDLPRLLEVDPSSRSRPDASSRSGSDQSPRAGDGG